MRIRTNSSNNTVYADADGVIGYYHGNYIPKRDTAFDWSQPVDGSNPATEWQGLHTLEEMVTSFNPETGWLQNCNATPFTVAGYEHSPKREDYPTYMAPDLENFRGLHAMKVLDGQTNFTTEKLMEAAYDTYLTGFEKFVPALVKAYETSASGEAKNQLKEAIDLLGKWDLRYSLESVETSLAVYSGQNLIRTAFSDPNRGGASVYEYFLTGTTDQQKLEALQQAISTLEEDFGSWKTPWGEINRYQRLNGDIRQPFNDDEPSLPVDFASGRWGSLASFGSRTYPGTKKMYGTGGNSFVAFVEFGEKVKAKSILTGGQSGDPASPHFDDQAEMYTKAQFKDVRFY
ncbi:MAG: penicillin acylase family protein, partial [Bacteroidota bacterium]